MAEASKYTKDFDAFRTMGEDDVSGPYLNHRAIANDPEFIAQEKLKAWKQQKALRDQGKETGPTFGEWTYDDQMQFNQYYERIEAGEDIQIPGDLLQRKQHDEAQRAMDMFTSGMSPDEIEYEFGRGSAMATVPHELLDPVNLVIDAATGFTLGAARTGVKAGIRQLGKAALKETGRDIGAGLAASAAMDAARVALPENHVLQMISGFMGPTVTKGLMTMGRRGLIEAMKKLAKGKPEAFKQIVEVAQKNPEDTFSKRVLTVAGDIKRADATPVPETPLVDSKKAKDFADKVMKGELAEPESDVFNFKYVESSDDLKSIIATGDEIFEKQITKATRGKVTHEQTINRAKIVRENAKLLGTSDAHLNRLAKNVRNMDAHFLNSRYLLLASAKEMRRLAEEAITGGDKELLAMRCHAAKHAALQAELKGVQTEIARTLNSMKIPNVEDAADYRAVEQVMEQMGGHDLNKEFAQRIIRLGDEIKLNKFVRRAWYVKAYDALMEYWTSSILSGYQTQAINATTNAFVVGQRLVEKTVGLGWRHLRRDPKGMEFGDLKAELFGLYHGLTSAVRLTQAGKRTLKEAAQLVKQGELSKAKKVVRMKEAEFGTIYRAAMFEEAIIDPMTKFEETHKAISAEALQLSGWKGRAVDLLGTIVRAPSSRVMLTVDELFKSMHYHMELYSQAFRAGRTQNLEGEDLAKFIKQTVDEPPKDFHVNSIDAARYGTFQQDLGQGMRYVQKGINEIPFARFVVPFMRTPVNIVKYWGERTPGLNLLSQRWRAEFKAGGARRDLALGKLSTGIAYYTIASMWVLQGKLRGGGEKGMGQTERLVGAQDYSLEIGGKQYSFNRFDPFGMFLGVTADLAAILPRIGQGEGNELLAAFITAMSKNVTSKTYLEGLSNLVEVMSDPERYAADEINRFFGSFIPNFVNQFNRGVIDNSIYEIWSALDAVKARIPGLSKTLPPSRNLFAQPQKFPAGVGPDMVSPLYEKEMDKDPVKQEIWRLQIPLTMPAKSIEKVDLTADEWDQYVVLAGDKWKPDSGQFKGLNLHDALAKMMKSREYKNATDGTDDFMGGKAKMIKEVIAAYREGAKYALLSLEKNSSLAKKVASKMAEKYEALSGDDADPYAILELLQ